MARKRMVDRSIWHDEKVALMTIPERLLLIGMMTLADDEGRLPASVTFLLGAIFPNDQAMGPGNVRRWRDAIVAKNPNVILYQTHGVEYIAFRKWAEYQRPSHPTPSRLPAPEEFAKYAGVPPEEIADTSSPGKVSVGQVRLEAALAALGTVPGWELEEAKDRPLLEALAREFPSVDAVEEIRRFATRVLDRGLTKNYRLALRTWFRKAVEFAARDRIEGGASSRGVPPVEEQERLIRERLRVS